MTAESKALSPIAVRTFDLAAAACSLREDEASRARGRSSTTLVKLPGLRVVLMSLRAGTRIERHQTDGQISIHVLRGRARLMVDGKTVDLPAGGLLALERLVPHDVEAIEPTEILLTIAS